MRNLRTALAATAAIIAIAAGASAAPPDFAYRVPLEGISAGQPPDQGGNGPTDLALGSYAPTSAQSGQPYSIAGPSVSGGTAPYQFAIGPGLPGATIGPDGGIAGTAGAAGTFSATVTVTDGAGAQRTAQASLTVSAVAQGITAASYPNADATVGEPATIAPTAPASGGIGNLTYELASVSPANGGISVNAQTGVVSVTSGTTGNYTVAVRARDASNATSTSAGFQVSVASRPTVSAGSLPEAQIGSAYVGQVNVSGGTGNYSSVRLTIGGSTYEATPGGPTSIGSGLTLQANGQISGTPTDSAKSLIGATAQITDTAGRVSDASAPFDILVRLKAAEYALTNGGGSGSAITIPQTQPARGGTGTATYSVASSPSHAGITIDPQSGTVTVGASVPANNYSVTVTATDTGSPGTGQAASVPFTVAMVATIPRPASASLIGGTGKSSSYTPAATGAAAVDRLYDGDSSTLLNFSVGGSTPGIMWMTWTTAQPINCVIIEATRTTSGSFDVLFLNEAGTPNPKVTTPAVGTSPTTHVAYSGNASPSGANALVKYIQIEAPLNTVGTIRTLRAGKKANADGSGSCITAN